MSAGMLEPFGDAGAKGGWFEVCFSELAERLPDEADPILSGSNWLRRGKAWDVQRKNEVDFGMRLALLNKGVFAAAEELASLGVASQLLLDFPHQGLPCGFKEFDVSARQIRQA